jgi:hypothetical protein
VYFKISVNVLETSWSPAAEPEFGDTMAEILKYTQANCFFTNNNTVYKNNKRTLPIGLNHIMSESSSSLSGQTLS